MSYVGNVNTGDLQHLVASTVLGSCTTLAAEQEKIVSLSDFDALLAGVTVYVKFMYSNTAASPTLNVNNTGAKPIYVRGVEPAGQTARESWDANSIVSFTYTGTAWMLNDSNVALEEAIDALETITGNGVLSGYTATDLTGAANEVKAIAGDGSLDERFTATDLTGAVNENKASTASLTTELTLAEQSITSIVVGDTNETGDTLAVGTFVWVKNHTTLADGLYTVKTTAIVNGGSVVDTNMDAVSEGGLNTLKNSITTLSNSYNLGDSGALTLQKKFNGTVGYRKYNGIVTVWLSNTSLSGMTANADNSFGTLPVGFRPPANTFSRLYANDGYMYIAPGGDIVMHPNSASGWNGFLVTYVAAG